MFLMNLPKTKNRNGSSATTIRSNGNIEIKHHIGKILVDRGVLDKEQLDKALDIRRREPLSSPRSLGQILAQELELDHHKVMQSIAEIYAFNEVEIDETFDYTAKVKEIKSILDEVSNEIIDLLFQHRLIPWQKAKNTVVLATSDPSDSVNTTLASQMNFPQYEIVYCRREILDQLIEQVYQKKNKFLDQLDEMEFEETALVEPDETKIDEEELDAEINRSMLNSLIEGVLLEAVRQGASDIHMIPKESNVTEIHFRVDGKLQIWHRQEGVKPEAISAVIKDKTSNVDRFERSTAQDGFIQRVIDGHQIRYRVSILPIVGQEFTRKLESVVIRVLDDRKVITNLEKLGLQRQAHADFVKAITKPSGIVIMTGPTGSGKSTTLVAALSHIIDPSINVLTVEEPVEYLIKGARQLKIGEHMSFDHAMRGILRHDPDVVLVGEIRDLKTAEIAIKLANTGHLTFSTLHTNDAPSAISRLYKMGVEPFLIANAVNLVMAQRLVRTLCENCKEEDLDIHPEIPLSLGFTEEEIANTTFYKAVGCNKCHMGYKGRAAIMEALYFTKEIRNAILDSGDQIDEDSIRNMAMKNGMLTLRASGRARIKEGVTSLEEVAAVTVDD